MAGFTSRTRAPCWPCANSARNRAKPCWILCAAPGGKTTYIAQLMNNQGRLVAHDIAEDRLELIRENCPRLGVTCVETDPDPARQFRRPQPSTASSWTRRAPTPASCAAAWICAGASNPPKSPRLRTHPTRTCLTAPPPSSNPAAFSFTAPAAWSRRKTTRWSHNSLAGHPHFNAGANSELIPFADGVDGAYVARLTRVS